MTRLGQEEKGMGAGWRTRGWGERKGEKKGEQVRMKSREWEWVALRWEGTEVLGRKRDEGFEVDLGDYIRLGFG